MLQFLKHIADTQGFKPYEQVWHVSDDGTWRELRNTARDSTIAFCIDKLPESGCLVHTHVHSKSQPGFSLDDWELIKQSPAGLRHFVYHVPTGQYASYDPTELVAYTGRDWSWSVHNCYSLCRDWYKRELSIDLPDRHMASPDEYLQIDFGRELAAFGFRPVLEPQWGDIVVMQGGHLGIWLSSRELLHHCIGRQSATTRQLPAASYWRLADDCESFTLLCPDGQLLETNTLSMPISRRAYEKLKSGQWQQSKGYRIVRVKESTK